MNKQTEQKAYQNIRLKLNQGLNGVYYKEYRRAQLLSAYDAINGHIRDTKDCAEEWSLLRRATRDTVISFSSRKELNIAIRELEKVIT